MSSKRKIAVGSLVKNSKTKNVGIVIKIIGDEKDPDAIIVRIDGHQRKWSLKQSESSSLLRRFFLRITLALKDLLRILSSVCK